MLGFLVTARKQIFAKAVELVFKCQTFNKKVLETLLLLEDTLLKQLHCNTVHLYYKHEVKKF